MYAGLVVGHAYMPDGPGNGIPPKADDRAAMAPNGKKKGDAEYMAASADISEFSSE